MTNIRNFTIEQVQDWLYENGFSKHMEVLESCEVNGEFLVEMTQEELTSDLGFTNYEAQQLLNKIRSYNNNNNGRTTRSNGIGNNNNNNNNNNNYNRSSLNNYNNNATTTTSTYVPSAAAMGSVSTMMTSTQQQPASTTSSYTPSAAALSYHQTSNTTAYNNTANNGSSTPSIFAGPTTTPPPPAPSSSSSSAAVPYKPSAAAMGSCTIPTTAAATTTMNQQYATPSIFSAPPAPPPPPSRPDPKKYQQQPAYKPSAAAMGTYSVAAAATPQQHQQLQQPMATAYVPSAAASGTATYFVAPPAPAPQPPRPPNPTHHGQPQPTTQYFLATPTPQQRPRPPQQQHQPPPQPPQQQQQQQQQQPPGVLSAEQRLQYEQNQPEALKHADIWMISGCEDRQTSADISNVNTFQLPDPHGRAGGACTAALLNVLYENDKQQAPPYTFTDVMMKMRKMIRSKGLDQIPQLTSTHPIDMNRQFQLVPNGLPGTKRAVIIGINYTGQKGELRGCHNDAFNMKKYIERRHGFHERNMKLLIDDGRHQKPIRANILAAYKQVVAESRPGDAIFLHYSGHGTKVKDLNGDEADGYDEALVPLDFKRAGQIIDDDLYKIIVEGLPKGVHVVSVMDCCHSGTILDLPYIFKANGQFSQMEIEESYNQNKMFSIFGGSGGGGAGQIVGALVVGGILGGLLG